MVKWFSSLRESIKLWLSLSFVVFACCLARSSQVSAQESQLSTAVSEAVLAAESSRIEAIDRAVPTAVSVFVPGGAGGGSGVLISPDGYALTNFHVSSPAGSYMRCGLSDGNLYDAVIVGIDPVGDLALIKLLGRDDFPHAEIGNSDRVQAGDWCFVVGNPFLLAANLEPTVTWGMLSGVRRYQYPSGTLLEYADCLQTDASINPGNSGGPLFDASGRLIGIVGRASFEKRGRVNVGVGYAISINQAMHFLGYLRSGRIVDHATLGATVVTDPEGAVRVSNILESSDAYRRGLRYNDEIVELAGRNIQSANDLKNVLGTFPKGWRVPLAFIRNGKRNEILVRLPGVHGEGELLERMGMVLPPPPPAPEPKPMPPQAPDQPDEGEEQESMKGADGKPIPAAAAGLIEERTGFANYHFNRIAQERIVARLRELTPPTLASAKAWTILGEAPDPLEIQVKAEEQSMKLGEKGLVQATSTSQRFEFVDRRAREAILPALEAWRRMLEVGPAQFGDVVYWGTAPLLGDKPYRDVLVGTTGELEYRFFLHPDSGRLEAIEVFADRAEDPAEIFLQWAPDAPPDAMPSGIEVHYGTDVVLNLKVTHWTAGMSGESS